MPTVSTILAIGGLAMPVVVGVRLRAPAAWRVAVLTLPVIIFQAMLGMWTVTWLLKPIVVMAHLLDGLTLFAMLAYVALRLFGPGATAAAFSRVRGLRASLACGVAAVAAQIALGGWTSANFAAMACDTGPDSFPRCSGQWWPAMDFSSGFVLWRGIGVDYEGGVLDFPSRAAIQMTHRIGAVVVMGLLVWAAWALVRAGLRGYGWLIAAVLTTQVCLGISNVWFALPLRVATAHNGVAALLLLMLMLLLALVRCSPTITSDGVAAAH